MSPAFLASFAATITTLGRTIPCVQLNSDRLR